jgi:hypothetical protein
MVVSGTKGRKIASTGFPSRVRRGVVEFAVDGPGAAAGRGARRGTGADQVLQLAAGPVPFLALAVVAGPFRDRGKRDPQLAQQFGQLCPLMIIRAGAGGATPGAGPALPGADRGPRVLSAGAAVGDGLAVAVKDG